MQYVWDNTIFVLGLIGKDKKNMGWWGGSTCTVALVVASIWFLATIVTNFLPLSYTHSTMESVHPCWAQKSTLYNSKFGSLLCDSFVDEALNLMAAVLWGCAGNASFDMDKEMVGISHYWVTICGLDSASADFSLCKSEGSDLVRLQTLGYYLVYLDFYVEHITFDTGKWNRCRSVCKHFSYFYQGSKWL